MTCKVEIVHSHPADAGLTVSRLEGVIESMAQGGYALTHVTQSGGEYTLFFVKVVDTPVLMEQYVHSGKIIASPDETTTIMREN